MSIRDKLRKAASLFVELPPEEPPTDQPPGGTGDTADSFFKSLEVEAASPKTVDQVVRESSGPNLDEIQVPPQSVAQVITADGKVDYNAIYQQAQLPTTAFTAEQILEVLASLPTELPLGTKRQTVKTTLGTLGRVVGATPESIVADASRKLAALNAYVEGYAKQTADFVANAQLEIAALQAQIEEKRKAITQKQQEQAQITQMCEAEADRLDDVLEFFSLDVPPSKYAAQGEGGRG